MSGWIEVSKEIVAVEVHRVRCRACNRGTEGREHDVFTWKRLHEATSWHRVAVRRATGECLPKCEEFEVGSIGEDECVVCKAPREVTVN